jgi:hypothetical protein
MFDITKKRALETAKIDLVNGDGSPLYDDDGNVLSVTVNGPGSKLWQQADAERNRRRTARIEKNRGRITAALDNAREDEVDFLTAITVSFNGWDYPCPEGQWPTNKDMFRATYADDTIGYIRDHVHKEATDWSVFTKGSATS